MGKFKIKKLIHFFDKNSKYNVYKMFDKIRQNNKFKKKEKVKTFLEKLKKEYF